MSANFPNGTRKVAAVSIAAVVIQLNVNALTENSAPIDGKAIFTDEPIKVVRNDDSRVTNKATLLLAVCFCNGINCGLTGKFKVIRLSLIVYEARIG
jgi:hypothetical protein